MYRFLGRVREAISPGRPPLERRLHERALSSWQKARGRSGLVQLDRFGWRSLEDHRNHGFLLDVRDHAGATLVHIGPVLRDEAGIPDGVSVRFPDLPQHSLIARLAHRYRDALTNGEPVVASYEFVTSANYLVLSRGVLLPLSSDGQVLDHVYGVISWKSERLEGSDRLEQSRGDRQGDT